MPRAKNAAGYDVWVPIWQLRDKPHLVDKARAWHNLTRRQKERLEEERKKGRFGGQNAKGVGRAPYFWVQSGLDAEGAIKAGINPSGHVSLLWETRIRATKRRMSEEIKRLIR